MSTVDYRGVKLSEADLIASVCRDSLYSFLFEFWPEFNQEEFVPNWHIEEMCNALQEVAERVFRGEAKEHDLVINVPPGTSKSSCCSIAFQAWVWARMPTAKFICVSHAFSLAMQLANKTRDLIKSDKYKECFPEVKIRTDQDTKEFFVNTKGGYRFSLGTAGSVVGKHAHFIIVDDPVDPKAAASEGVLKEANRWMDQDLSQRKVNKAVTPTVLVMQRLSQSDPTDHLLNKGTPVRHVCLPATLQDNVKPRALARFYQDGLLDPIRLSRPVLEQALKELGQYGYSGQMDQRPAPAGGGMFKVDRFNYGPPPRAFKKIIRFWDKAASVPNKNRAWTVGTKMAEDLAGRLWVLDVKRGQWDSFAREQVILQTARADGHSVQIGLEEEGGSGGKESARNTIRMLAGYRVVPVRAHGDKVYRADPFSVQVNEGNFWLAEGAHWLAVFLDELENFPHSKYKDIVDSCSGAFTLLTKVKIVAGPI